MNNDDLEKAISHLGLDLFGADTKAEVENLLANGQTVEPEARQKLITAAQRALRLHAVRVAAFQVLAFEIRMQDDVDIEALSSRLKIDPSDLRAVESSRAELLSLAPSVVAEWIDALDIDSEVGLASVSESLHPRRHEVAYGSADKPSALPPEAQKFLDGVRAALESRRQST